MQTRTYLDHAALWPLRPEARAAWQDAAQVATGDPARAHAEGRAAGALLERATAATAAAIGADASALTWTSGGTEAVHLAVLGSARADALAGGRRRHVVCSAVEHSAVLAACERLRDHHGFDLDVLEVDRSGAIDPDEVARVVSERTLAVHLQHANHEVGTLQPVVEVGRRCAEVGAMLHVDACQTVGQLGLTLGDLGADLLTASAAKFGGPRGVGLLALGPRGRVGAVQEGDDRQRHRRAGQLDVPSIAAAAVALQVALDGLQAEHSARELVRRHLRRRLPELVDDVEVHGPLADAHPGIVAVSALYVDGEALVHQLDAAGFAVHSGSSCASTSGVPSHVLMAMRALTHGHVRVSHGPDLTVADADRFAAAYAAAVADLRGRVGR
ncbi:MAG: aminotransferase class V-fold PLP-dependent enzyme [Nitriliruptor sp.]